MSANYEQARDSIIHKISEHISKDACVQMCLVGGAAMHHYVNKRHSEGIDAFFRGRGIPLPDDLVETYIDDQGHEKVLYFDTSYNTTFGLMHPDVADKFDVTHLFDIENISVHVLKPEDLVISKLARFSPKDEQDIKDLIEAGLVDATSFLERANESLEYYVGRKEGVLITIDTVYQNIIEMKLSGMGD